MLKIGKSTPFVSIPPQKKMISKWLQLKLMHLLRNYFVFNYTYQSDPNEKTLWTMYSTPGRGQIESEDCKYHFGRSGDETTHIAVSRLSEL